MQIQPLGTVEDISSDPRVRKIAACLIQNGTVQVLKGTRILLTGHYTL